MRNLALRAMMQMVSGAGFNVECNMAQMQPGLRMLDLGVHHMAR